MSNSENQNGIMCFFETVKRNIASFTSRNDQFAQTMFDWAPNERVSRK